MKNAILKEGLDHLDMENQVIPTVSVDEYVAKMGANKDIVTLAFIVKSQEVGKDLVEWFENGYDYVLDASTSSGELEPYRWLVFVEMSRRSTVPSRIIEMLSDLKTLTNLKVTDWTIVVDEEEYEPDEHVLKQVMILNPNVYKEQEKEESLNEYRELAGLDHKPIFEQDKDKELKDYMNIAGL